MEIGFGLGLNFLLTADTALAHGAALDYYAFERDLIDPDTFNSMAYGEHLQHPELAERLSAHLYGGSLQSADLDHSEGITPIQLTTDSTASPDLRLQLSLTDATAPIWPADTESRPFDAVYLDAFSPDTNAECWTEAMLSRLFGVLRTDGGTLATYCAKGVVRRRLEDVGFTVHRHPGPPGKREVLSATRRV